MIVKEFGIISSASLRYREGMASPHGNVQSESAKMEQIITEFFAKSLHIILESRSSFVSSRNFSGEQVLLSPSSSTSSSSSVRPRDKWFNLALRDCPAALENIDFWRQSNFEPMVVDVILVQRPLDWDPVVSSPRPGLARNLSLKERFPNCWNSDREDVNWDSKSEKIIERWIIQYKNRKSTYSGSNKRSGSSSLHTLYKKSVLLMRSLYLTVRLLPGHKLFHDLNSSNKLRSFTLGHRVSSFVEPFTSREESHMQRFGFTPIDTNCGRLCVSVMYHSAVPDISSEPCTPLSPQFIPDYVGSPLTDTLKRFPSLTVSRAAAQGTLGSSPYARRHSWSSDNYRASPPCISCSPSPTYSDSRAMVSHTNYRHPIPMSLPPQPSEPSSTAETKSIHYDKYWASPSFSPSTSSAPPVNILGTPLSKVLVHSGSAPVTIPPIRLSYAPSLLNRHAVSPSPSPNASHHTTSRSDRSCAAVDMLSFLRGEAGRTSGEKTTDTVFHTFSRSSSRISLQDDFDDPEFACPFDMDDDDVTNRSSRPESLDQQVPIIKHDRSVALVPVRKSRDAAVGTLVQILKKAPPLRQDFSRSLVVASAPNTPELSSTIARSNNQSKTISEALNELQNYQELKDLLLNKSGKLKEDPGHYAHQHHSAPKTSCTICTAFAFLICF